LDEVHRELGITSLLVTHDQEEALELAQQVIVMHEGRIEQAGTPHEIYNEPATPFVASFVGAVNVLKGLVIGGQIQFGDYYLPGASHLADGSGAHAYVRPHDVVVSGHPVNGSSTAARVDRVAELGWIAKVHLVLPDGQPLVAEMATENAHGLEPEKNVFVDLRNAKVFEPGGIPASDELAAS
jgi:sulfate transport system ATP-binding protein